MKKWFRFFCLSFFSDKISKEGAKRGYTNVFIGLVLVFVFLWAGFVGGDMLPFGVHYNSSSDFAATAHSVFANSDIDKRICIEIDKGVLKAKKNGGEYSEELLVNTFENEDDKQIYSVNGYNVVVDCRPADTLAEVEAYCLSNDGENLRISYQEYLSLSAAAKYNFDFVLSYTGNELELNDELVSEYRAYVDGLSDENKFETEKLTNNLAENKITKAEYNRAIYELYFTSYYPDISAYESSSKLPLLRNYYYHKYISNGIGKYLFVFDDYIAASFETEGGIIRSFYGFYSNMDDGSIVSEGATQTEANKSIDQFINTSFKEVFPLTAYAYAMNIFTLIPFIALMPMVVALLAYSIIKLRGIESITSLGAMFKIIGSYVWVSGVIAAVFTVIFAFFVQTNILTALPLIIFFLTLATRSIIFTINEAKSYLKQLEQKTAQTEE